MSLLSGFGRIGLKKHNERGHRGIDPIDCFLYICGYSVNWTHRPRYPLIGQRCSAAVINLEVEKRIICDSLRCRPLVEGDRLTHWLDE